jgi:hypothetical protein
MEGMLAPGCTDGDVGNCAKQRGVEYCAHSNEYVCRKLETCFVKDPSAKKRLDKIGSRMS